jgi:hypothetical protein
MTYYARCTFVRLELPDHLNVQLHDLVLTLNINILDIICSELSNYKISEVLIRVTDFPNLALIMGVSHVCTLFSCHYDLVP